MKKIGIMTFWETQDNYGQILQGFAMQSYLKKLGHEPYTIKFHRVSPRKEKSLKEKLFDFRLNKFIKDKWKKYQLSKQPKNRNFDQFRSEFMSFGDVDYYTLKELKANPPKADVYITGSDQVWNTSFKVPCEPFLLGFGNKEIKRVAYAASFGQSELNEKNKELFKSHLDNFDTIGVREKGGVQMCKDLGFSTTEWVPDPTLLFNKDKWSSLLKINPVSKADTNKIFIYTLGNSPINDREMYLSFLKGNKQNSCKHINANNELGGNFFPGVQDWVYELGSSNFVLTNSFHGMVFCIIYNINFVVLPNTGNSVGMNDRINSLLEKTGLTDHQMFSFDETKLTALMIKKVDWTIAMNNIEEWKKSTSSVLENI